MDNDVSVARLSDDDDWNDRTPPGPRSRMRMLAVMGAVVVGCVVAAVAVNLVPDDGVRRADDRGDRIVVIDPDNTELYPTTGDVAPTTDDDRVVVTDVTDLSQDGDTSAPQDGTTGEDGGSLDDPADDPGDSDEDDTPDDDRDEDENDRGDENDEDTDDTTSPGPSDTGTPGPTSSRPSTSTPPTTTPPGEDEEDEEDEGCSPWWWPGCW
ncbi:hypothetical protein [Saccharomonospora cyanea]|uniref:Uncharacterized protein n=1 Tax=Saccharomonospora cyanea NA-134 TaxID=882082 RepID=H5XDF7_9PSEU|nr:hypothetical protein [Saccharomonospora cyanea]EHR60249.1 hypothetical protein SaccyDRAFT_1340 [Saccharomonospora cyanea NA-134]